jgi:predicted dehydrogenase
MKIGVLGAGSIGKRHIGNIIAFGHQALYYDPALSYAEAYKRNEVLDKCDAIIIASPTKHHLEDFSECIERQKPVFIEKPIGDDLQAASVLVAQAEKIGLPVMVGYNLRFHPSTVFTRSALHIDRSRFGNPLWAHFVCAQFNAKEPYKRDGVILNWSHEIDLAISLLGPADLTCASVRLTDGHDDMADIHLAHHTGCRTSIHIDYLTAPEKRYFQIAMEGGTIDANLLKRDVTVSQPCAPPKVSAFDGDYSCDYRDEFRDFLRIIDNKHLIYGCTAREALEVLKICTGARQQAGLK